MFTNNVLATALVSARPVVCAVSLRITVGDEVPGVRVEVIV